MNNGERGLPPQCVMALELIRNIQKEQNNHYKNAVKRDEEIISLLKKQNGDIRENTKWREGIKNKVVGASIVLGLVILVSNCGSIAVWELLLKSVFKNMLI